MPRRLATPIVLVLVFAPLAATSARPLLPPVSAPGDFAADPGCDPPAACRRSGAASLLAGVLPGARGSAAGSVAVSRVDARTALVARRPTSRPRVLVSARFRRKHLAAQHADSADPSLAL
jgi:hypothetical protein